jgi:hypothetical protein
LIAEALALCGVDDGVDDEIAFAPILCPERGHLGVDNIKPPARGSGISAANSAALPKANHVVPGYYCNVRRRLFCELYQLGCTIVQN